MLNETEVNKEAARILWIAMGSIRVGRGPGRKSHSVRLADDDQLAHSLGVECIAALVDRAVKAALASAPEPPASPLPSGTVGEPVVTWPAVKAACTVFAEKMGYVPFDEFLFDSQQRWLSGMRPALEAAIAASPPTPVVDAAREGWRPIDTAPKTKRVLVASISRDGKDWNWVCDAWKHGKDWVNGTVIVIPTHWQPLPAPPTLSTDAVGKEG